MLGIAPLATNLPMVLGVSSGTVPCLVWDSCTQGTALGQGERPCLVQEQQGGRVMMHMGDHGGEFGAVCLAGPGDSQRGGPGALLLLKPHAPSLGTGGDPALSPPQLRRGGGGHGCGGAASSSITCILSLPKKLPRVPPIPVMVPFSPQHERARGL